MIEINSQSLAVIDNNAARKDNLTRISINYAVLQIISLNAFKTLSLLRYTLHILPTLC